jgi:hypothetical protein
VLGMLLALPLVISFRARHPPAGKQGEPKEPRVPWGRGKKKGETDRISRGTEPHGID